MREKENNQLTLIKGSDSVKEEKNEKVTKPFSYHTNAIKEQLLEFHKEKEGRFSVLDLFRN